MSIQRFWLHAILKLFLILIVLVMMFGVGEFQPFYHLSSAFARVVSQQGNLQARVFHALPRSCVNDHKTDYPDAIDCIVNPKLFDCNITPSDDPCTYNGAQRPADYSIKFVVIHDIEGTASAGINTFHNPKSQSSIHYIVDTDGTVYQLLREKDIALHAGNLWYNQHAIGIEHAGYSATGYRWYSTAEYQASARLTAYLLKKYHIPLEHAHVTGHGIIPASTLATAPNHTDPGPYWLWDYYLDLIHKQGVPYVPAANDSAIFMINFPGDHSLEGRDAADYYSFASLYNGPSTSSSLIPHARSLLDELSNIEPAMSYVATAQVRDPAGSGKMMYRIWYGVETHIRDRHRSNYASARQVWLAVDDDLVSRGYGTVIRLITAARIYSCPNDLAKYQIGDAPAGALFVSPGEELVSHGKLWYMMNYNHRQAWIAA